MHAEGGVWTTLFGLLLWDVLFAPLPDVFLTPFQTAPLDLATDAFFPQRQPLIVARLAEIEGGEAPSLLRHVWAEQEGRWCRGVNWERHSCAELSLIACCVGGKGLAAVCRVLAEDYSGWGGGMPDLLLWRVATAEAKVVEVKGPRDRLSDQQRAWLGELGRAGIQTEVAKVVETEELLNKK